MEAIAIYFKALGQAILVMGGVLIVGYLIYKIIITQPKTYRIIKEDGRYIPQKRYYWLFWKNLSDDGTTRIYNERECKEIIEKDKEKIRKVVYYE